MHSMAVAARSAALAAPASLGAAVARARQAFERDPVWYAAVAAVAALQLALIVTHDPWFDEWQALLIALESTDFPALLQNLRYEGHPPLWYLLLQTASKFVPPLWTLAAVQCVIALATQAIILLKSPFPRLERLLLATSFFILFEYGTIARSLGLGVLLLFAVFAFRDRRIIWTATALLPMVDFQFGILSFAALLLHWLDDRWSWPGFFAWGVMGAAAAVSVIPPADVVPALAYEAERYLYLGRTLNEFSALLLPLQAVENKLQWNGVMPFGLSIVGGPAFILFSLRQTGRDPVHRLVFSTFLTITLLFSLLVYPLSVRHLSLVAILLILLTWRACARGVAPGRAFRAWLAGASACGILSAGISAVKPFDVAPEVARFIEKNRLQQKTWIAWPYNSGVGVGVSALTGVEFMSFEKGCTQSFVRWNAPRLIATAQDFHTHVDRLRRSHGDFYLLTGLEVAERHGLAKIAGFEGGYGGQDYFIYAVRGLRDGGGPRPAPCAP